MPVTIGEFGEASRMHILHGPPGSHHLHERQDDDDYGGGGAGPEAVIKFSSFVKKYYERIADSAGDSKK